MTKPTIRIHNTETNKIIDREMTDAEYVIYQAEAKSYDDLMAKTAQAVTDKTALLAKLGITADEAKLLLS